MGEKECFLQRWEIRWEVSWGNPSTDPRLEVRQYCNGVHYVRNRHTGLICLEYAQDQMLSLLRARENCDGVCALFVCLDLKMYLMTS